MPPLTNTPTAPPPPGPATLVGRSVVLLLRKVERWISKVTAGAMLSKMSTAPEEPAIVVARLLVKRLSTISRSALWAEIAPPKSASLLSNSMRRMVKSGLLADPSAKMAPPPSNPEAMLPRPLMMRKSRNTAGTLSTKKTVRAEAPETVISLVEVSPSVLPSMVTDSVMLSVADGVMVPVKPA